MLHFLKRVWARIIVEMTANLVSVRRTRAHKKAASLESNHSRLAAFFEEPTYLVFINV